MWKSDFGLSIAVSFPTVFGYSGKQGAPTIATKPIKKPRFNHQEIKGQVWETLPDGLLLTD